ncbi:MAG: hypothetical protein DRN54_03710 [Thaumarchaeota archaeon]|nr:MAG: hypothetical protein DRN54_03710 [Nitrososphaerota archaeon]
MALEIKLISFDAWDTLLRLRLISNGISERIGELSNLSPAAVYKRMIEVYEEVKDKWVLGKVEDSKLIHEAQGSLAEKLGVPAEIIRRGVFEAFDRLNAEDALYPEVVEVLEDLSRDFQLAVVSNVLFWPGSCTRKILEEAGISRFFKVQLYADEVGVSKPDKRIFVKACELCGVDVRNVVHVGDSILDDVGGALASGMRAVLIRRNLGEPKLVREVGLALIPNLSHLRRVISDL